MKANPCSPGRFFPSPFSHCSFFSLQLFTSTPSSSLSYAFSRVNTFLPANLPPLSCLCSLFLVLPPHTHTHPSFVFVFIAPCRCISLSFSLIFFSNPSQFLSYTSPHHNPPTTTTTTTTLSASYVGYLRGDRAGAAFLFTLTSPLSLSFHCMPSSFTSIHFFFCFYASCHQSAFLPSPQTSLPLFSAAFSPAGYLFRQCSVAVFRAVANQDTSLQQMLEIRWRESLCTTHCIMYTRNVQSQM